MTPEEKKELATTLATEVNQAFAAKEAGLLSKVKELTDAIEAKMADKALFDEFQKQLDAVTVAVKKFDVEGDERKSISQQIKDCLNTNEFKSMAEIAKKGNQPDRPFVMNLKVESQMTEIAATAAVTGNIPPPMYAPGVAIGPYRQPFLRDIINNLQTESNSIWWIEESSRTDGSAFGAEASVYGQGEHKLYQRSMPVERVAEYMKISDEMFTDIPYMQSLMSNKLMKDLALKIDANILTGSGTPPALKGWDQYITAYAAPTGMALNIVEPNYIDLLVAAITQVRAAYQVPNYVVLNPVDSALLKMQKDKDGAYVNAPFMQGPGFYIDGIPVISNFGVTQGTFYVVDSTKSNFAMRKEIEIRLWDQNSTDPIYGLKTITAVARCAHWIATIDATAFVSGSLSQANLNALTRP